MAEKIGDAILELKTDSKKFDRGIKKAGKQTQKLEKKMKRAGLAAQMLKSRMMQIGAALIAGYALTKAIKGVTDLGDKIAKMSARTGVATETLSAFRLVMNLGGASIDSFAKGMKTVSKMMFDIKGGAGAEAKKAFDDIDVSIKNLDGSLRDPLAVFYDISDAFAKMEDGARKSAVAQTVLGRAGIDLIPTINQGSDAIKKQVELAEKMGYTFSKLEGQQMEEFTDAIEKMETSFKSLWENAVIKLTPSLTKMADAITDIVTGAKAMNAEMIKADEVSGAMAIHATRGGKFAWEVEGTPAYERLQAQKKIKELEGYLAFVQEGRRYGGESMKGLSLPETGGFIPEQAGEKIKAISGELEQLGVVYGNTFSEMEDKGVSTFERVQNAVEGWASGFSGTLNDMLWGAETTFTGILQSFGKMITQMIIQTQIIEPLISNMFKGGSLFGIGKVDQATVGMMSPLDMSGGWDSSWDSGFTYGSNAKGGIVNKPTFSMLAEREPEIVAPLSQLAGMGGSNVEVNIIGAPEGTKTEESTTSGGMRKIDVILDEKMANNIRSGSKTFTAMTKAFSNLSPQLAGR